MTTMFRFGFQQEAWRPTLGQAGIADVISKSITSGADAYKAYTQEEIAKEQAQAAQTQAAAAAAAAQAAAIAAQANKVSTVLGIPTTYFVAGVLGLGALAAVVALSKKK